MIYNYQYRLKPTTEHKLVLNDWLRICQYWYNRQLGERFDWWEQNRSYIDRCLLVCHLPELKDKPEFYGQKKQLPVIKQDLVIVGWSGELLDFNSVPSQTLQEVCKRVKLAFERFIAGDSKGKRSGKPRYKNTARFRSIVFDSFKLHSCSVGGKWLYLSLPKIGIINVRHHRPLPNGAVLKQAQIIKKSDGWYINLRLQDDSVPDFKSNITPSWNNSLGMDAVLHEDDYLATSEGVKLPSLKSFRSSRDKLAKVSKRKSTKKKGSKSRRKLAKREAKLHSSIARARKDHAYNTAHALLKTGKKVFFHEKLNLVGLSRRNKAKTDTNGKFLPNGQSAKSGLNKSWADAAFGQFFNILKFKAEKAGALVIPVNPQYTSMLLPYKDEFVFTDCGIREYWDEELNLLIDRDVSASINVKRVGLDLFPTIKRCKGNPVVIASTTNSTLKEVLSTLRGLEKPALYSKS
ncbi:transposase (plasmid) [Chondrocystis sp. NIES-4102]|nr:transposase [Chondrocystis sp. NIES-4102]BAZ43248.1 transposase [Chondrocystis sp. NIES-4102]BAZ43468.1 transposase [Chondrocystis sp. NIES-4102]BAZ43483.1 transposase [Chondrocystis sp. NIES-4102]BAZ44323.1 transposase [Chondrocystis sp. NIES-4102]